MAEQYGAAHLSSGKLLRKDPKALAQMEDGRLAPASEVERVVGEGMGKVPRDQLLVLDGFPRRYSDVEWLEQGFGWLGSARPE